MTKVYEVEKIIGHRKKGIQIEYHIQWKGYSLKQSTYEPEKNILDKNMLQKYQKKHNLITSQSQTPVKKSIKKQKIQSKTPKKSIQKKSVKKVEKAKSTPKSVNHVKEIHNNQKDVSKLLQNHNITSILHVFKDDGKSLYTITIGKFPNQYLVSSQQLAKHAKPDLIVRFFEKLIR